jgi:DNA-directed RNA polymerase specialized sigma24 family protein
MRNIEQKRERSLAAETFQRLLTWLDEGTDSEGEKYLEMRRRLLAYFDRKNCAGPDDLADETLNRVARRLEEEGKIETETPAKYCYIVARFVFLESLRAHSREESLRSKIPREAHEDQNERETRERVLDCLDKCTGKLDAPQRELILSYYVGREKVKIENRRILAKGLGISMNALSIRACRIRDKLEGCVRECVGAK